MFDWATAILYVLIFAAGASIGSFVNAVAYRLPRDISIVRPRSFCPQCRHPIAAWANIPLLSYPLLRGRCRQCGCAIPFRYPITELVLGLAALYLAISFPPLDALIRFVLCAALCAVSWIDFDWRIIPDAITLPGIPIGVLAATFVLPEVGFESSLIGLLIGGGVLFLVGEVYRLLRRRDGMGMGDVKLLAMIGAFMGWPGVLFTMVAGSAAGIIGGVAASLIQRAISPTTIESRGPELLRADQEALPEPTSGGLMQTAVPFGPFLSLAAGCFVLFQPQLITWYFGA